MVEMGSISLFQVFICVSMCVRPYLKKGNLCIVLLWAWKSQDQCCSKERSRFSRMGL